MWIAHYNRNSISEGLDHSDFGIECATVTLSSSIAPPTFSRTLFDFASLSCPASMAFARNGELMLEQRNTKAQRV